MLHLLLERLKNIAFLICFVVMIALFIPVFYSVDFDPFLSILLLIAAATLAAVAKFAVSGIRAAALVATSGGSLRMAWREFFEAEEHRRQDVDMNRLPM